MSRIHFIGTVHGDPAGETRLKKALQIEKPTILTLEYSKELEEYVKNEAIPAMHEKIDSLKLPISETESLKNLLYNTSFEITTARGYALSQGIPLHYVDHPSVIDSLKANVSLACKLPAQKFKLCLRPLYVPEKVKINSIYADYQKLFESNGEEEQQKINLEADYFGPRDSYMAESIEKIIEPGARIVHVGGIGHCLKDSRGRTLFSKLRKYNPTRETLRWYEDK
ncbi:MAG TPA: hypothetical protein VJB13_01020 [Candidatus Nanoarchaeia archaeon]|nr:hypothetical protein [Candidatus Nanoarchaeia archaeon]